MCIDNAYILSHFEEAINAGHIKAYFQPLFRSLSGKICGAEALARWEDPENGLLSPADFIPVLENNGLIYRLDMAILRCACETYCELKRLGDPVPPFSINLSRLDFQEADLFEVFTGILREYDVPVSAIDIEITESMLGNASRFTAVFDRFQDAGFHIWIDDFGSGYSSLSVIQDYSFNTLKIDMLFLRSFSYRSRQMLSAIVNTSKRLGVHTLIEGVETEEQASFMKRIGCEVMQGYFFSKPLRREAYVERINSDRSCVESDDERPYYDQAGLFNVVSTNPLEEYGMIPRAGNPIECISCQSDIPLALVEYDFCEISAKFIYVNDAYIASLYEFGYQSIEEMEQIYNDRTSPRFMLFKKIFDDALVRDTVQETDYLTGRLHSSIKVRCIGKTEDRSMLALSLRTFQSASEDQRMEEFARFSQSVFMTYDHVVLFFPDEDKAERIYSVTNFERDFDVEPLHKAAQTFCNTMICEVDRERYRRFIDTSTLADRVNRSEGLFIQQAFRIIDRKKGYVWRYIRVTKIPAAQDNVCLFTMQSMSPGLSRYMDFVAAKIPDQLELDEDMQ